MDADVNAREVDEGYGDGAAGSSEVAPEPVLVYVLCAQIDGRFSCACTSVGRRVRAATHARNHASPCVRACIHAHTCTIHTQRHDAHTHTNTHTHVHTHTYSLGARWH